METIEKELKEYDKQLKIESEFVSLIFGAKDSLERDLEEALRLFKRQLYLESYDKLKDCIKETDWETATRIRNLSVKVRFIG